MDTLLYARFVLAHDDFYADPGAVYRAALQARYHEPENSTGFRSTRVYHERGVKARLEKILGVRIKRWDTDPADGSGIFCVGLSAGRHKEQPGVHADFPWNDITVVVYLTPGLPPDCGTSLWMHRATGLADPPSQADARRLGQTRTELLALLERDSRYRQRLAAPRVPVPDLPFTACCWTACTGVAATARRNLSKSPRRPMKRCSRCCTSSSPAR